MLVLMLVPCHGVHCCGIPCDAGGTLDAGAHAERKPSKSSSGDSAEGSDGGSGDGGEGSEGSSGEEEEEGGPVEVDGVALEALAKLNTSR